jgi:microcin C transport system permease protein
MKQDVPPPSENAVGVIGAPPPPPSRPSVSVFRRRIRKFRTLKRGYYAFLVLVGAYALSFALPLLINNKALVVRYHGSYYFPIRQYYPATEFGMEAFGEPNYRELKKKLADEAKGDWVLMPPYPYSPTESLLDLPGTPPNEPSREHPLGTDTSGRDVFARLAYGFNVSLTFALLVLAFAYSFGIMVGATLGYFGSIIDIGGQRLIEIWSSLPFLYTIIIISSIVVPNYTPGRNLLFQQSFWLLIGILAVFDWMNITYYVRGEYYREKAKDYIGAAIAMGVSEAKIMFRHILPNALTPVISFAPFTIVANISALVALDFLGFGLPAPTPSWGELIGEGVENLTTAWWLVVFPIGALFLTLLLIVLIGESVRDSFDPKEYSRLR